MPKAIIEKFTIAVTEGFVNADNTAEKKNAYVQLISVLIAFFISLIILSLIGKLLWNGVIVELFTCVRPAKNFWQILGLFVFLSLLY